MALSAAKPLMSVEEAVDRLAIHRAVSGVENVPLVASLGRVLAEDIRSSMPIPALDNSAMDGFAFRFADIGLSHKMEVIGRVAAGHPMTTPLPFGKAVRIFTGGIMPPGADTVAMQEDCVFTTDYVALPPRLQAGANRRLAGEDVSAGSVVLGAGHRLRPQDIAIAAATGRSMLPLRRRVRVAVLATGDELCAPGTPLPHGSIYDTNRHAIAAALYGLGAHVTDLGLVPDKLTAITEALAAAASDHDLIISSGGVSVGDEDHVRPAVLQIGTLDFWKLALKPGKPIAVGDIAGTPFVGLPGNPVSAMITFWLIARPLILRLMGAADLVARRVPVVAAFHKRRSTGRREYLPVRVRLGNDGKLHAEVFHATGSAMLASLVWSEGLVEILENRGDVEIGDTVGFVPYESLGT